MKCELSGRLRWLGSRVEHLVLGLRVLGVQSVSGVGCLGFGVFRVFRGWGVWLQGCLGFGVFRMSRCSFQRTFGLCPRELANARFRVFACESNPT